MSEPATIEEGKAELARRVQTFNEEFQRYGPDDSEDKSPRGQHLRARYAHRRALIEQAHQVVSQLTQAAAVGEAKTGAQAAIAEAQARCDTAATRVADAQAAAAQVDGRVSALRRELEQLLPGRDAGLAAAQAALREQTIAGDQAGAAAAAQTIVKIKAKNASIEERAGPLQLQLVELESLRAGCEAPIAEAQAEQEAAAKALRRAEVEVVAILRDEAALDFHTAQVAYQAAASGVEGLPSVDEVRFRIGASSRLLDALGGKALDVHPSSLRHARDVRGTRRDAPIFDIDPLQLNDMKAKAAADKALRSAGSRRAEVDPHYHYFAEQ